MPHLIRTPNSLQIKQYSERNLHSSTPHSSQTTQTDTPEPLSVQPLEPYLSSTTFSLSTDDDYESRLSDFSPKLAIPQPMHFQPQDLAVLRGHSPSSMDGSEVELVDASDQPPPTSIFGHSGIHQLQHSSTASTSLPTLMSPDGLLAQLHTIFALPQQYLFFPKLFSVGKRKTLLPSTRLRFTFLCRPSHKTRSSSLPPSFLPLPASSSLHQSRHASAHSRRPSQSRAQPGEHDQAPHHRLARHARPVSGALAGAADRGLQQVDEAHITRRQLNQVGTDDAWRLPQPSPHRPVQPGAGCPFNEDVTNTLPVNNCVLSEHVLSAQSSFGSERRASLFGGPSRAPPLSTLYKQPLQYLISLLLHHIALFLFNRFLLPFATHKVVESLDLTVSQTMPSKKLTVNPRSDSLSTGSQFLTRSPSLTSLLSATSSSLLFPTSDLYFNPVPPSTPATKAVPVMKLQSSVKPPPPSRSHSFSRSASSKKEVPQSKVQIPFTSVSSTPVPQPHLQPSPSPSPLPSPIQSNAFANVQASTTSSVNVNCFITRLEMIDDDDMSTGMPMDDLVFPSTRQNGHKKIRLEELLGALSEALELLQSQTTQPNDPDYDHFESPSPTCTLFPPAAVDAIMCEILLIFSTKLTEALLQPPFGFSMTRGFQLHLFVSELIDWAAENLTHVQPFGAYATNRELSTIDPFIAVVRTDNGETVTPIPHQPYPIVSSSLPALFSSLAEFSFILFHKERKERAYDREVKQKQMTRMN
ncbi:hypothetical protein BLNAU_7860 [Blattamonas nauphoetae]|uniref:Uncharacterized protein n=1 Tax=Blattamonas nauphoetae TaxID=2049346 RepID=A0ABQ9Y0K6_9EUKA|nr:hypothetical protein BLNAU_7860 [Blattamonas nauphoetae]